MLESLSTVMWHQIQQPEWNAPNAVPEALRSFMEINCEEDAQKAYDRLLYSLGNNHAGTYYPVVLFTIPFIAEILRHSNSLVREAALGVLVDLASAFEPERGFETITSAGRVIPLRSAVRDAIAEVRPTVEECASAASFDSRERRLSAELLSRFA